jgi:hypothetical protein
MCTHTNPLLLLLLLLVVVVAAGMGCCVQQPQQQQQVWKARFSSLHDPAQRFWTNPTATNSSSSSREALTPSRQFCCSRCWLLLVTPKPQQQGSPHLAPTFDSSSKV